MSTWAVLDLRVPGPRHARCERRARPGLCPEPKIDAPRGFETAGARRITTLPLRGFDPELAPAALTTASRVATRPFVAQVTHKALDARITGRHPVKGHRAPVAVAGQPARSRPPTSPTTAAATVTPGQACPGDDAPCEQEGVAPPAVTVATEIGADEPEAGNDVSRRRW